MAKTSRVGRKPGTPNLKNAVLRDEKFGPCRVSTGFNKTIDEILASGSTKYKSKADVIHAALQVLAARELPANFYWINKIY